MGDDEIPSKEVSPELLAEMSGKGMKWVPTLNDMMRSRCDSGEEHQYHLYQIKSYIGSQTVWESRKEDLTLQIPKEPAPNGNSETRKYVLSLHKIHAFSFPWNDLEELNIGWVKKGIRKRDNPDKVYLDHRIVDVIRVQYDQGYGQEFMKEIVVKISDGEYNHFLESDYKYLHKNEIEDMYLMCMD
ncbi:hypothetical protein Tco_0197490, partial [Tanacetum coccineum]